MLKLTVCPLWLTEPAVADTPRISTSAGIVSVTCTLLIAMLPGLLIVIVHVALSPGIAKGGFTLLVMNGSTSASVGGCPTCCPGGLPPPSSSSFVPGVGFGLGWRTVTVLVLVTGGPLGGVPEAVATLVSGRSPGWMVYCAVPVVLWPGSSVEPAQADQQD